MRTPTAADFDPGSRPESGRTAPTKTPAARIQQHQRRFRGAFSAFELRHQIGLVAQNDPFHWSIALNPLEIFFGERANRSVFRLSDPGDLDLHETVLYLFLIFFRRKNYGSAERDLAAIRIFPRRSMHLGVNFRPAVGRHSLQQRTKWHRDRLRLAHRRRFALHFSAATSR